MTVIPETPFLCIPEVTSETRKYVPIGWLEPPNIPSNKLRFILGARLWHFGIFTSAMHMAWLRVIGGRLESRFQYSIGIVYNNFPLPTLSPADKDHLEELAQKVLDARSAFPDSSLADLYSTITMPTSLRKAHSAIDGFVDRLYRVAAFADDQGRAEHLLERYEALAAPLLAASKPHSRRRGSKAC